MAKLSDVQKSFLKEAAILYSRSLPGSPAEEYLEGRGLPLDKIRAFGLGYVTEPLPGHNAYRNWLSIPYLRWGNGNNMSVIGMRFRCLEDHDHKVHGGKYKNHPGGGTHLFNTQAALNFHRRICLTEGELDTVALHVHQIPSVGCPGSDTWNDKWVPIFKGFDLVYVLCDGDNGGELFGRKVTDTLPKARIIMMEDGEDVNSMINTFGIESILERIKHNETW